MRLFHIREMAVLYSIGKMVAYKGYSIQEACEEYGEKVESFDTFRKIILKEPGYASFVSDLEFSINNKEKKEHDKLTKKQLNVIARSYEQEVSKWRYYENKRPEIEKWEREFFCKSSIDNDKDDSLKFQKNEAIKAARELYYHYYDPEIFDKIMKCSSLGEINRIMATARKELK